MVRDQGLRQAKPLGETQWATDAMAQLKARWPTPPARVLSGRASLSASPSLPGFDGPKKATADPLAVIGAQVAAKNAARKKRREAIRKQLKDEG